MSSRIGSKRGLLIGGLAVAALLVFTALPGMAASNRTISLQVTPSTAVANSTVLFKAKVTNNSPAGSVSNPSSIRVTVPSGFTVTGTPVLSTQASGESTNANASAVITTTATSVTVNSINPLQRLEFVTVQMSATTADIACSSGTLSGPWAAAANTGSTFGSGSPFTQTGTIPKTLLTKSCFAPTISIVSNPDPATVAVGATVTFTATVTGDPSPTVTWQYATDAAFTTPMPATCADGLTCTISPAIGDDGLYYRAQASNGVGGSVNSNVIQIDVFEETIQCGDTVPETGGGTHVDVTLVDQAGCEPKDISIIAAPISGGNKVEVLTSGTGTVTFVVNFNAWAPEPQQTPVPASTAIPPEPLGETEVWCDGTYSDLPADLPENGGTYGMSMPSGHTWCRILQTAVGAGVDPADPDVTPDILPGTPLMKVSEISLLEGDAGKTRCCV